MSRLSRVSKGLLRCDCALLAVANASPALERAEHEVTYKERESHYDIQPIYCLITCHITLVSQVNDHQDILEQSQIETTDIVGSITYKNSARSRDDAIVVFARCCVKFFIE